ncbi:MAG: inovirus-type Gp2 protein [Xanthomonadales bacterium]|nr:inovirus-type Gp2 protein [Xanthomonadales bacterium]
MPMKSNKEINHKQRELSTEQREYNHHLLVRKTTRRDGHTYIGPEFDFINYLIRLEKLALTITDSDSLAVELSPNWRGNQRYRLTKLGRKIFLECRSYDEEVVNHYEHHRFNPYLTVMLKAMKQWAHELVVHTNRNGEPDVSQEYARDTLGKLLTFVRAEFRRPAFKDEVENYKRNEEKNIASCCKYMAAQFGRRTNLLILRIDFYFRPSSKGWGYTREADCQYGLMLRALREDRIVDDVLGYIGKREEGIDRGVHFHVLIVLDGHLHRDALNLTRAVGEYWVERCGKAEDGSHKSSYFNCYTRKDKYEYNCLGLVRPTDRSMMKGLRLAIEYMCKETSQLKPSPPKAQEGPEGAQEPLGKGIRNLRKGIMPKGHSGRGAPRSSGLDTSVIDRELLKKQ